MVHEPLPLAGALLMALKCDPTPEPFWVFWAGVRTPECRPTSTVAAIHVTNCAPEPQFIGNSDNHCTVKCICKMLSATGDRVGEVVVADRMEGIVSDSADLCGGGQLLGAALPVGSVVTDTGLARLSHLTACKGVGDGWVRL